MTLDDSRQVLDDRRLEEGPGQSRLIKEVRRLRNVLRRLRGNYVDVDLFEKVCKEEDLDTSTL